MGGNRLDFWSNRLDFWSNRGRNGQIKFVKFVQKSSPLSSWSKIRYLLHINGRRSPFVRWSSRIRWSSLRWTSRQLYFFSLESSGKALFQTENFYWKIHLRDIKSWIQHTLVHQLPGKTPFMMTHPLVRAWKGVRHRVSDSVFSVSSYILELRYIHTYLDGWNFEFNTNTWNQ